ncbi:MAG: hypothetical protein QM741_07095 [Rudaea sp.]|uniref:YncE family protein n=1 Tax=Rudaea sp. TaxID=2136325 RepID=UPI0039E35D05
MSKRLPLLSLLAIVAGAVAGQLLAKAAPAAAAEPAPALEALGRIELPGYTGNFEHFAADLKGNRLFLAAEGHDTLEAFDLRSGKHLRSIAGIGAPHDLLYLADVDRLIVTQTGADGETKVIDGATYQIVGSFRHTGGAESMGYDAIRKRLYAVAGGHNMHQPNSWLVEIDPYTGRNYGELKFAADHVGALVLEKHGNKLYVNVTGMNEMAVVDKNTRSIIATWPIAEAQRNIPLAFDEATRRLFVATRAPSRLLVLDADTGATVTSFKAPVGCDQVLFDRINHRVYALGSEGYIGVFAEKDRDHYEELPLVASAPGAKTGILIPQLQRLYVAASPGSSGRTAALLSFNVLK